MTSEMEDGTACMCIYKPKAGGIEAVTGVCCDSPWLEKGWHVFCRELGDIGMVH